MADTGVNLLIKPPVVVDVIMENMPDLRLRNIADSFWLFTKAKSEMRVEQFITWTFVTWCECTAVKYDATNGGLFASSFA